MTRARYVRDGAKSRQKRGKRRGAVFCVRLTDEERKRFEDRMMRGDGPRSLGAWLKWRATEAGNTSPAGSSCCNGGEVGGWCAGCPSLGNTRPGERSLGNTRARGASDKAGGQKGSTRSSEARLWKRARKCPTHPSDQRCDFCKSRRARNIVYPPPPGTEPSIVVSCTACDACLDGPEGPRILAARLASIRKDGITRAPGRRVILDLCAGSGSWSAPYAAAGYEVIRVTLPHNDVRTFKPPENVWGVLAAPPCEVFSLAANGHAHLNGPDKRAFDRGLEVVSACLRVIAHARPQWWAIENPAGYLSRFLGPAEDLWEPFEFGDPWTKRTAVWGRFAHPKRGPYVKPVGPGPLCTECTTKRKEPRCSHAAHRAVTPPGFARAFFEANP